ncbi:MAG: hypothetical protein BWY31_00432 [Lentisphaerae bacterium ADurb.Bin242]|nr:MAG: hypothetical protein BWY31_00432 [Lentisphaerae bacterium ADurb.Bin242]
MGAEAYTWITKYRKNLGDALAAAREETFAAGKFIGAGEKTATIEKAIELGAECGTGSLLDIVSVSDSPELCSVCPVSREDLLEFFGTERPSFAEIEKCMPFWESFDRGEARAVTLYENGKPAKICFAGWTIDVPAAGSGGLSVEIPAGIIETPVSLPDNGWPVWNLVASYRTICIIVAEVLREPANEVLKKAQEQFSPESGVSFALLNHGRDFLFAFPPRNTASAAKDAEEKMNQFLRSVEEIDRAGFMARGDTGFPNEKDWLNMVAPFCESDSCNQVLIKVKHADTIVLNHPMTVTLKFHPRKWYLNEGEVPNFSLAIEKADKIINEWFYEAKMVGFQNEFVFNDDFYIERVSNGCKFKITCKEPVQFPFWELYLRLRSGLTAEERYSTLSFSGSRAKKAKA